jgi:hypothetical protein
VQNALIDYLDCRRWRMYTTRRAGYQKRLNQTLHKVHVSSQDLDLYRNYLSTNCDFHLQNLQIGVNVPNAYKLLAFYHSLLFGCFNARRATEPSNILLDEYENRNNYSGSNSEVLNDFQKALAKQYDCITSRGKVSQNVMSMSKIEWRKYVDVMTDEKIRTAADIPKSCKYMYGNQRGNKPIDNRPTQEKAARECGAENPNHIRARYIRTTFANYNWEDEPVLPFQENAVPFDGSQNGSA